MSNSLKQSPETFTVEQSYYIAMDFFSELWFLIQRIVDKGEYNMCWTFFTDICCCGEYCAEWNEAVHRVTGISKEQQRSLYLALPQIFRCALEFCKLHNKQYNNELIYTVNLLESMEKEPGKYREEWNVWEEAIQHVRDFRMNDHTFRWQGIPAWPYD